MAHSKSAEKRIRQNETRRLKNRALMNALRTQVKKAREALAAGDAERAKAVCAATGRALDKAAARGLIHRNNASRHKARLAKALAKIAQPKTA